MERSFNSVECWFLFRIWSDFCKDLLLVGTWNRTCFLEQAAFYLVFWDILPVGTWETLQIRFCVSRFLSKWILTCSIDQWSSYHAYNAIKYFYFFCISVRPENVRILSKREPLSAGRDFLLECKSHGSRPPATITWWKNSKFLNNAESQV